MTGAPFSVTVQDKEVQAAFRQLEGVMRNTTPVMKAIGTGLVGSTHQRFISGTDPDGNAWAALNKQYAETKTKTYTLVESGLLRDSINSRASSSEVRVGPNKVYAAIHQFGGEIKPKIASHLAFRIGDHFVKTDSVTIPARPYLGISKEDETMIAETIFALVDRYMPR
ncbi:phage virion morphogenesis (putative tail completion) protein [Rhizobium sp. RU35A]|uniref:phage virion morphogenesis protein n=1 Tax=Rhizobium sp. RU35A TaxID=1907414 RepID=UPI00095622FE|nr:phage virion morphogenesis protein [Rhizobium sp. RU35A]SIQ23471.1 phage virion morphogenesis (putative tail completion) protein [Rhizobium sp. RU35A]